MERRVLIAIFLSFLVLYAYQAFFAKPQPKPGAAAQKGSSTSSSSTASVAPPSGSVAAAGAAAETTPTEPTTPAATALVGDQSERDARLETAHVIAVFTNRGARLKSWKLKDYLDHNNQPLELVETSFGNAQPLPFSLQVPDHGATATLNNALYTVRETGTELTFAYRNDAGLAATKSFTLNPSTYTIELRTQVTQGDAPLGATVQWGPGLGDSDSQTGRYAVKPEAIFSSGGSVSRLAASKVTTQPAYDQEFDYAGVDDHYFAALAVKPGRLKVTYQPVQVPPPAGSPDPPRDLMAFSVEPPQPDRALTFYVGPKDFDTLAAIDPTLTKAINFGMFSVLVVPLLRALEWIHSHVVSNYGWAIVILTLVINLILFPLNHKSVVSMRKMQEIQPEAKAIQERYKNLKSTDPAKQKMNQELMGLYKEHGVNPASGCLPMLLILPVFLAFYSLLQTAIALRGAPFFGWIHDLSLPDAYYVLPILVGASQIITQIMTPQPGADPAQQKMMMIMPLVLIFVFVSTPAGALIYWLVGNVWRVGQMQISNYLHPPKVRVVRPAAERRVKRVGGSKTDAARES